jgi:hypothetical protein
MQPSLGRIPVSVLFDGDLPVTLVSVDVATSLSRSALVLGRRFTEVLMATREGRSFCTDVECEVASSLEADVLVGSD